MLRLAAVALLLVTLALLEAVVTPAVAVAGVGPDLTVLAVAGIALSDGPGTGARAGFAAGVLRDLLGPPGALLGPWMLALLAVGFVAGTLRPYVAGDALSTQVAVGAAASALAAFGAELLGAVLGVDAGRMVDLVVRALVLAGWGLVFAPIVVRPTRALAARSSPASPP